MIFYIEKIFKKFDWAKKRSIKFVMEMMYLVPEATAWWTLPTSSAPAPVPGKACGRNNSSSFNTSINTYSIYQVHKQCQCVELVWWIPTSNRGRALILVHPVVHIVVTLPGAFSLSLSVCYPPHMFLFLLMSSLRLLFFFYLAPLLLWVSAHTLATSASTHFAEHHVQREMQAREQHFS